MKQSIILFACACAASLIMLSCSGPKETADANIVKEAKPLTSTFKILSINTAHQIQDANDVKKFAQWAKATGADVITVQQIERATEAKPGFDAVSEVAKKLDMRFQFGKARYFKGWDSGNALFSLYPIQQSSVFSLPVGKGKVRRSFAYGVVDLGLKQIGFGSTELDEESESERLKQASEIFSISESMKEYPVVIGGVFGEPSSGKAAAKMLEKFFLANSSVDDLKNLDEHVYVPATPKFNIVSAAKVKFNDVNLAGLLVTVEIIQ